MSTANLSVVLANYNHARYLPRALDAILSQSVRPREVIVIDDASTRDNSLEVLDGYARRDPIVRVVRNETNLGVVATYNKVVGFASGEYLFLAAADDYVLPGFLEKCARLCSLRPAFPGVTNTASSRILSPTALTNSWLRPASPPASLSRNTQSIALAFSSSAIPTDTGR